MAKRALEICAGLRRRARELRHQAGRPRGRAVPARRGRDGDRDRPPADHARGLEARLRRLRAQGGLDGQDPGRRRPAQGGRHGDPADAAPGAIPRTRRSSGCTATPARPAWSTARREVHKMVLARALLAEGADFWSWVLSLDRTAAGRLAGAGRRRAARRDPRGGTAAGRRDPGELAARASRSRTGRTRAPGRWCCAPTRPRPSRSATAGAEEFALLQGRRRRRRRGAGAALAAARTARCSAGPST